MLEEGDGTPGTLCSVLQNSCLCIRVYFLGESAQLSKRPTQGSLLWHLRKLVGSPY